MRACGDPRRPSGWITDEFVEAYLNLHGLGWAHSVETRTVEGDLVGGLYGVEVGGLFAGESMFSRERDASKVALVALVGILAAAPGPGRLLDVQWQTDHLETLGAVEIDRPDFLVLLAAALALPPAFAG
jgi:leucyl/phenylalanyl-tRNA--protein transferase